MLVLTHLNDHVQTALEAAAGIHKVCQQHAFVHPHGQTHDLVAGQKREPAHGHTGDIEVDLINKRVRLSKIFKWYAMDFGTTADLLSWTMKYLPHSKQTQLKELLRCPMDIQLSYRPYDWDMNSS